MVGNGSLVNGTHLYAKAFPREDEQVCNAFSEWRINKLTTRQLDRTQHKNHFPFNHHNPSPASLATFKMMMTINLDLQFSSYKSSIEKG